jgi:hypothetical protein
MASLSLCKPAASSEARRLGAVLRSLDPVNVQGLGAGSVEVELRPARQPSFLGTKAMPLCQKAMDDIAERVPATFAGGDDQPTNLIRAKIISFLRTRPSGSRRTFPGWTQSAA